MPIPPTTNVTHGTNPSNPSITEATGNGVLDKDGFLKLLVGQLRHQDPMNAVSNEELMGQMIQLSMLEQVTNLTKANEELAARMETSQALELIGRDVSYEDADGETVTGKVEKVELVDGDATLTVNGQTGIDPSAVTEVR